MFFRINKTWYINAIAALAILTLLTAANYWMTTLNPTIGRGFLIPWVSTRALLDGKSPYDDETSQKIETLAYHQPEIAEERELRFVMPLYASFLFIPFSLIPEFNLARAIWLSILELLLFLSSFLVLRVTATSHQEKLFFILLFIFANLWYFSLLPIANGHVIITLYFFLILTLFCIKFNYDEIAAISLSLTFIKPHLVWMLTIYIILWMLSHQRWHFIVWFFSALGILFAISFIIQSDWIIQYLRVIFRYADYNRIQLAIPSPISLKGGLLPRILPFLSIGLGFVLIIEWIFSLKSEFPKFLWVVCLTLCASMWLTLKSSPGNYILLTIPLLLIFTTFKNRLSNNNNIYIYIMITAIFLIIWGFAYYPLIINNRHLNEIWFATSQQWFTLLLLTLVSLYWIRWWISSTKYPQLHEWGQKQKLSSTR